MEKSLKEGHFKLENDPSTRIEIEKSRSDLFDYYVKILNFSSGFGAGGGRLRTISVGVYKKDYDNKKILKAVFFDASPQYYKILWVDSKTLHLFKNDNSSSFTVAKQHGYQ